MPEKTSIWADNAPAPDGHYAQAIKLAGSVHIAGQLPLDANGKFVGGDASTQSRQVLKNLTEIIQAAGGQMSAILKVVVYLVDLADAAAYDEASKEVFFFMPPARTIVQVAGLPHGARICVDATAEMPPPDPLAKSVI